MSIDKATPDEWNKAYRATLPYEPINLNNVDQAFDRAINMDIKTLGDYVRTKQIAGNHYKSKIEPWDVFLDWELDPWACNVIKYIQRHRKKAGKEDLEKAKHYLEFMISNYDTISGKYYK
jgi:hypothetical protein